jgi:hypothetical protein
MTKKPILYFLCFVIFGCNFLSSPPAVTPNPTVLPNPQLFQPPDCIRSCWQGLRLGETNAKELEEFFASNRGIFGVYNREGNQKLYIGIHKDNYEISALVKDDVLSLVRFGPSIKLVFSDIVDALGFPNLVIINWPNSPDPAANKLSAEMYYPEAGFVFSFSRSSGLEISHVLMKNQNCALTNNCWFTKYM